MKIVFMGTPEFAVPVLEALQNSREHAVVGVVTAADKPVGRGLTIKPSPVKKVALKHGIPIFQPTNLEDPEFIETIRKVNAELYVVVAFRILPPAVFNIPASGTINLHASLLPKYRGAAPINWAIINGEQETGLTTFFIQEKVDTGDILLQQKVAIGEDETAGELHDRLAALGAEIVLKTVNLIMKGQPRSIPQSGKATKAPKLTKELSQIKWERSNHAIRNLVRGLSPSPGACTLLHGRLLKIFRADLAEPSDVGGNPGEVVRVDPRNGLFEVVTGQGNLEVWELQPEAKRRMTTAEFLRGYTLEVGEKLGG